MEVSKKISGYFIFALQVFLVFILLFESRIEIPAGLQSFGRVHPLLLHLPIGLLLISAVLIFSRKIFQVSDDLISFLLYLTSLTASLSALMGIFLSREGGYTEDYLVLHKWFGVGLSFLCWFMLSIEKRPLLLKTSVLLSVVVLTLTGHFGASLTHGESFVLAPLQRNEIKLRSVTDSSTIFYAAIEPILENKCYSCHNETKAKGKLILTSIEAMQSGGKNGKLWVPGDAHQSLLVERINLPIDSRKHMPPKDKPQLTSGELAFIALWIEAGADTRMQLRELSPADSMQMLANSIIAQYEQPIVESKYKFEFVSQDVIQKLNTPYRTVLQIARNEPALQVDFFLSGNFQDRFLEELLVAKDQIISLNLSKMPVDDNDLLTIAQFLNLEKLTLNSTKITGRGLKNLVSLKNLRRVSVSGTATDLAGLKMLATNPGIREVFFWNTKVKADELNGLTENFPEVRWEAGYYPDEGEMLRLSPPFLKNDHQVMAENERIELKHKLPGVSIRYTTDQSSVDSLKSEIYQETIEPKGYTILKTKAYKDGWFSSNEKEYVFFRKGHKPAKVVLKTNPDKQYPGEGGSTLIDDKKGMPDFYRDPSWMAFRNEPLEADFYFKGVEGPEVEEITLSYARNIYAMCMPPASIEVWGGNDARRLKLLGRSVPAQPEGWVSTRIEGATVSIPRSKFACYKIIARPLSRLPDFRDAKKERGWLMVDEVFFN